MNSIPNRAGLMHSFVIALFLLLIAFGIVLAWLYRSGALIDDEADVNLCRATLAVQWKSRTDLWVIDFNSPLASSCKRRIISIGEDAVTVRSQAKYAFEKTFPVYVPETGTKNSPTTSSASQTPTLRKVTKLTEVDEAVVASVFAESMKRCWTMGLEGDVEVMDAESTFAKSNVCVVCDEIDVDRGLQAAIPGTEVDNWLTTYLEKTMIPSRGASNKETYAEFLDRSTNDEDAFPNTKMCAEQINLRDQRISDGTYATLLIRRFSDVADEGCMTTAVVSATAMRTMCTYVAN